MGGRGVSENRGDLGLSKSSDGESGECLSKILLYMPVAAPLCQSSRTFVRINRWHNSRESCKDGSLVVGRCRREANSLFITGWPHAGPILHNGLTPRKISAAPTAHSRCLSATFLCPGAQTLPHTEPVHVRRLLASRSQMSTQVITSSACGTVGESSLFSLAVQDLLLAVRDLLRTVHGPILAQGIFLLHPLPLRRSHTRLVHVHLSAASRSSMPPPLHILLEHKHDTADSSNADVLRRDLVTDNRLFAERACDGTSFCKMDSAQASAPCSHSLGLQKNHVQGIIHQRVSGQAPYCSATFIISINRPV